MSEDDSRLQPHCGGNRFILFSSDLRHGNFPDSRRRNEEVERIKSETDLDHADLCQMECEVYFRSLRRNMASRFPRGASLWAFQNRSASRWVGMDHTG